jgi:hypothetical protein
MDEVTLGLAALAAIGTPVSLICWLDIRAMVKRSSTEHHNKAELVQSVLHEHEHEHTWVAPDDTP